MKKFITKVLGTVSTIVLFLAFVPAMAQYTKTSLSTGELYTAVAKDVAGNVYVTKGAGNGTFHVAKYTNGTGSPTIIYSGLTFEVADLPWGLAVAPNGDVYIGTDFTSNSGAIIRLNAASSYAATTVQTGRYFTGLTFDAAGNLYALEYNSGANDYAVCKYAAPASVGSPKTMLYHGIIVGANISYPNALAIAPSGDIYVTKPTSTDGSNTYTGGILKLNAPTYATTTSIATGTFATTLVLDDFGNLYASENVGQYIYTLKKYTGATGTPTDFYPGLNGRGSFLPYGVTFVGTTGYIADGDDNSGGQLIKLTPNDVTPPAVPTGLAVAAQTGQNTLTWTANGEADLLGYKVYGGTTASPTTLLASIPKGTTTFTHTGLANGTTYYYRISSEDNYFNESAKTADATGTPLPPATLATVTTGGNTPSYTSAALSGVINDNNATTTATFDWGPTNGYGSSVNATPNSITAGTGSTAVTGSLTSLTPGTTYYYRAKGVNSVGTTNGLQGSFTTLSLATVTTDAPSAIATTSATLGGNVTLAGSSAVSERGIVYSLTTNPTVANTKVQNGSGTGTFSATIGGLASGTLYYVKAYAINGGGPSYGPQQTFTTTTSTITAGSAFPAGLTTTYGVTSTSTSTAVSGTGLTAGITATPSSTANFEVSADDITYGPSVTIGSSGTVSGTVYVRLKATAPANASFTGSVTLTSIGANSPVINIPTSSVAKAVLTYTSDAKSKIYGAAIPALTGTVSGFVNSETIGSATTGTLSFTTTATAASPVGSFAINGTGLTAANYSFVQAAGNATALTITQRPLTVTANTGQSKTYGNPDPVLTYTVGGAGLYSTDTFSGLLGRAAGENIANYAITQGTLTAGGNYSVTFTPGVTFAINQRSVTVTANTGQSKTYGNVDPTITYTVGGSGLAFTDTFSGSLSRAAGENVTNYAITQGTLAASANYIVTFTPGVTFAINQRSVTVTANAGQSKNYGNVDPTLTYTVGGSGLAFADTFSGSLSRAAGENVANYAITQGSLALNANYSLTFTPGVTFAINQRAVTVTANAGQSKTYGNVNPTLTYSITAGSLAFADTFSGSLSRAAGENVGNYAITQGTLALNANYSLTFTPGVTFAINQRAVTVTANAGQSKIYGNVDPTLTYSITAGSLAFADTFSGSLSRAAGENVGNYAVTQGTLALSGNYNLTITPAITFGITQRAVTVTANTGQSKIYGNVDPTLTYTVGGSGLAFADTFSGSLSRAAGENVGTTYAITQGSLSAGGNYNLTFTPGATFAITQRSVTVTANAGQSKSYGNVDPTLTYTVGGSGLAFSDTFSGSLSRAAGENIGNYAITQGTLAASSNYSLTFTPGVTFAINKRTVTVTANAGQSKIYGNVDPTLTYTVGGSGLAFADTFSGSLSRAAGENVGNYAITQGTLALSANYTLTFTPGITFAINQRPVTVTANAGQSKTYGNADPTLNYAVGGSGLAFADTFSGSLSRAAGENVGNYAITQGTLAASGNYAITFTPGVTFAINQRSVTITANAGQSKIYGNIDPTITYTVGGSGLAFADTFSGSLGRAAGENVGNYAITQGTLAASGNYAITFTPGVTFAINQRSVTVTANAGQSKIYGNVNPTLTYTVGGSGLAFADTFSGSLSRAAGENVGNYAITQGTLAASSNYNVSFTAGTTFGITPKSLTVTATGINKAYDGTTAATVNLSDNRVTGDVFTLNYAGATFNTPAVGTNKPVSVTGITITGGASGNYTLGNATASTTADITARAIVVTADAKSKVYGSADPSFTYTYTGTLVGADAFTGTLSRVAGSNVGTYAINQGTLALSNSSSYTLTYNTADLTITPKTLTVTATGINKTYDGTTAATVNLSDNRVTGDLFTLNYSGATFNTAVVGTSKPVSVTGITISGGASSNYTLGNTTASTTADITGLALTGTFTADNKVYDGNTTASVLTMTLTGVLPADAADVNLTGGTATFGTADVGTGKTVTAAGMILSGAKAANYTLSSVATTTANITGLNLTGSFTAANKVYDGTYTATILTRSLTGVLAADLADVTLTGGTATFGGINTGNGKNVTSTGMVLTGAKAGNYILFAVNTTTANITAKDITGTFTAANKAYDGNTTANILTRSLTGVVPADVADVTLTGGTATFASATVGTGKTVTSTGMTLDGTKTENYNLTGVATTTANITGLALTGNFTAGNKVYDGNTTATILTRTLTGVLAADVADVTLTAGSATFADADKGTGKTVTATGMTLGGNKAGNYTLGTVNTTIADITGKDITASFTADSKVYDGNTTATILTRTLTGVLPADAADVTVSGGTATFNNENVGTGKSVNASGLVLAGAKGGNYNITTVNATTANITAKTISGNFTADNKVYDGNTTATVLTRTLTGVLAADVADVNLTGGTASFATAGVGTGKTVTSAGMTITGSKAANYSLTSVATTTANITGLVITGNITADNKAYDGNNSAAILTRTLTGVLAPDVADVTLTGGTATFADANKGTGKTVTATGLTLTGTKAANYTLASVGNTTADITAKDIAGNFTAADKVYDGNTIANILTRTLTGVLAGDLADVTLTGGTASFATANIGTGKTVTATGMSLSGTKAANYNLTGVGTTTANITGLTITGNFTAGNKVYDGNTTASVLTRTLTGVLAADVADVTLTGGTASFADANKGAGKTVTATGMTITGTKAANYTLASVATTTADITAKDIAGNFTADNKVYDGNTTASVLTRTLTGVLTADAADVILTGGTANFANANVGTGKTVSATGLTLTGTKAVNYNLTGVANTTANITTKNITGAFTADNKAYDGNTTAAILTRTLTGVLTADAADVTLTGGTASFADANIGTGKTVTSTGMVLAGSKSANYSLTGVATTTANIGVRNITGSFTADNKVYDGNTTANVLTRSLTGVLTADAADVILTGGTASFADANVATGKTVTATGMVLSGTKAANYSLTSVAATTAAITAKTVNGSITASNKVYDGTTTAGILTRTLTGVLTADAADVSLTGGTAAFADKNVGTAKIVTGTGLLLSGAKAANYTLAGVATTTANISAKPIVVTAEAKTKVYGDTDPALTYSLSAGALATGDNLTGALSRATGEAVGTYAIGQNTLTAGTNYLITYTPANLQITRKALVITADNKTKNFGAANPALTASYNGFVGTETAAVLTSPVVLSTTATTTSSAGNYPITASGAAAANYSITYVAGTLTINPAAQTITFAALPNKLDTDGTFTLTATASSGLPVTYTSSNPAVARIINGNQVEILKAGVINITASQAGSADYQAATNVVQSFTVIENPPPVITITSNKGNSISKGETAILTASGALTYQWASANGIISGQNTATLTVRPSQNTTYTVTGFNQYGRSSTKTFTLEVRADFQVLNIMNVITPNGDGKNDTWKVENIDMYPNNTVKVFDRSGKSVFEMKGYDNSWGGTFRGSVLPEGAYYYIIDFGPGIGIRKGYITIVGQQ